MLKKLMAGLFMVGMAGAIAAACADSPTAESDGSAFDASVAATPNLTRRDRNLLRALHDKFTPLPSFAEIKDLGWNIPITACFELPGTGGMGFHYGNGALIDGTVHPLFPEVVLVEPENGRERVVGFEFIVPFDQWTDASPPKLFGQEFMRNEAFGIYALHVWVLKPNPAGIFADWNPNVNCN